MDKYYKLSFLLLPLLVSGCALGPPINLPQGQFADLREMEEYADIECKTEYGNDVKAVHVSPPDEIWTEKFICVKK